MALPVVVFEVQHAGAAATEQIEVEVHAEWAPLGAK
jgi:hypothetical protein